MPNKSQPRQHLDGYVSAKSHNLFATFNSRGSLEWGMNHRESTSGTKLSASTNQTGVVSFHHLLPVWSRAQDLPAALRLLQRHKTGTALDALIMTQYANAHTVDLLQSSATVWPLCGFGFNVKLWSQMEHILEVFLSLFFFFLGGKYILC